jgi:demethylmenaquinone methyltransferase/2-methoxy-6-polyprenyl-1,4-benzoquinol methylase
MPDPKEKLAPGEAPQAQAPASAPAPGEATSERVHSIFSGIADQYDLFNALSSFGIDRRWRTEAVKAARLTAESRVLDLCAGTCDLALALARKGRPAEVVATDFVAEMLAVGERKGSEAADSYAPTKMSFTLADAQDLPFPDESFDVVTVAFGVRNLPDRSANFSEVLRVLKAGGRYVILEFSRPPFGPWRAVYHAYLGAAIPAIGGLLTHDRQSFQYLNDSIRRFPTQAALAAELREAGFSAVSWRNLTGGIVAIHTAIK